MKKSMKKTIVLFIAAIMLLASCSGALDDIAKEQKALPSAMLNTGMKSLQTRTMLPDTLVTPSFYNITLIPVVEKPLEGETPENILINDATSDIDGNIELISIPNGTYKVDVYGLDSNKQKIYHGTNNPDEYLVVENASVAPVMSIKLYSLFEPGTTGNIAMKFNWNDIVLNLDEHSGNSLSSKGPITDAIKAGKMIFQLYLGNTPETLKPVSQEIIWTPGDTASTETECVFTNIPVTKGQYAAFQILNGDREIIVDKMNLLTTVQVYSNQTSYYDGKESFQHSLGTWNNWFKNIYNLKLLYPTANVEHAIIFKWDDIIDDDTETSLYDSVTFYWGVLGQDSNAITNNNLKTLSSKTVKPATDGSSQILIEGLDMDGKKNEYFFLTQTTSLTGENSDIREWKNADGTGFKTKTEVTDIKITGDEARNLTIGDSFTVSATIEPLDASYNELKWESTNENVVIITDAIAKDATVTVFANTPGITRLKVSNNDPYPEAPNASKTTANDITIVLNTPVLKTAELVGTSDAGSGIALFWDAVTLAESYEILRNDVTSATGFIHLADVAAPATDYLDRDLLSGHEYVYKIIAKAQSYDDSLAGFKADSAESVESEHITIPNPQITLIPTKVEDKPFDITGAEFIDINGIPTITLLRNDVNTLELAEIEPGATYTWVFNGKTIKSGPDRTFTLSNNMKYIDKTHEKGIQKLLVSVSGNDGLLFSKTIHISMITDPVTDIILTDSTSPDGTRFSTNDTNLFFNATTVPSSATNPTVLYKVETEDMKSIATINASGQITPTAPGTVTFIAYAEEDPSINVTATYEFFEPTLNTPKDLMNMVNGVLQTHINIANDSSHFDGDWFGKAGTYDVTDTEGTGKLHMQKALGNATHNFEEDDPARIVFTNYKLDGGYTVNGTLYIHTQYGYKGASGYLGYDPVQTIGAFTYDNTLTIDLPNTQGKAYVKYQNISVEVKNAGVYKVWFEKPIKMIDGKAFSTTETPYNLDKITGIINPMLK